MPNMGYLCPRCQSCDIKIIKSPNILLLFYVINPGHVVNEIVFGQRVPKITFECNQCSLPRVSRLYVPCNSCGTAHDANLWSGAMAFGNWYGLVCPTCKNDIPCLRNVTSLLISYATMPLWWCFSRSTRPRWQRWQEKRLVAKIDQIQKGTKERPHWLRLGLTWGLLFWFFMGLMSPWDENVRPSEPYFLQLERYFSRLDSLLISVLGGIFFGVYATRRPSISKKEDPPHDSDMAA